MKKSIVCFLALVLVAGQTAFAAPRKESSATQVLTIGATAVPHAELLNLIKADMMAQGIELRIIEFTDYVTPNSALMAGDLDANYFQHVPYLESNPEWKVGLVPAFGVHVEPLGLYSQRIRNIADLPPGARIAIPNDPSNGGRALLLLQKGGLITIKPEAGLRPTPLDIVGNPKGLRFFELEAAQLPRVLGDMDASVINGNYALTAGLNPARDSILIEGSDSPYVNYVVVKRGNENDPKIKVLESVLKSQKIKDHINRTWNGSVMATF